MGGACSCCGLCTAAAGKISQRSARIAYCGIFALSLIIAWICRECAAPLMRKISWINTSSATTQWLDTQAVLRVSMGSFLFYAMFSLLMIGVKDQSEWRDSWHRGGWIAKLIGWLTVTILMFFLPNAVVTGYGYLSIVGAGLFLLVQVVILLDFTHNWNEAWVAKDEQFWYVALLVASAICYLGTFTLSGLLYYWFTPDESCSLNIFFITTTLILAAGFGIISLHPKVNGSLLPAAVISLYCAYVCYTGLSSEPSDYECNGLHKHSSAVTTSTLLLGITTTILSVVYSAVRAGSSTTFLSPPSSPRGTSKPLLQSGKTEEGSSKEAESRPVTYIYSFFYLIFALASMYSGMLLTGWTSSAGQDSDDSVNVGWPTVWVRVCTEWMTGGLFMWSLIAPLILPDREF